MPIYEYKCSVCNEVIELIQKIDAKPPKVCPACGSINSLKKLISHTSFELKGSGWYVTDYKNNSKPINTKSESNTNKGEVKNVGKDTVNH